MCRSMTKLVPAVFVLALTIGGCAAPVADFSEIQRPERSAELDPYGVFVGKWNWEAELLNAEGQDRNWTGQAQWRWILDGRCLHGRMSAKSARSEYRAGGFWTWHPIDKKYLWTMFNDWGFPQEGTADYDEDARCWTMKYKGVGLDGTPSYGCYRIKVIDNDTLNWCMKEWADAMHTVVKMEMKGTYKRTG